MKDLMTPDEVAEMLSVSRITIYRLIERRQLPIYRIGRRVRFRKHEIEAYLKRIRTDSA